MSEFDLKPDKKLGQNFLIDQNIVKKIISFAEVDNRVVLEIGAGPGTLTHYLSKTASKVYAVEIDKKILNVLRKSCEGLANVEIINEDFLNLDVKKLTNFSLGDTKSHCFDSEAFNKLCVVGNLPYYITSQILFRIFEYKECIHHFTIMIQKEVAQRLVSKPGSKDYGILTVAMNFYCDIVDYFNVSRNVFYPKPDVDSTVVKAIFKKDRPMVDEKSFFKFVHICFNTRRKTILNSLANQIDADKKKIENILTKCGIENNKRAEELCLDDFVQIFTNLKQAELL